MKPLSKLNQSLNLAPPCKGVPHGRGGRAGVGSVSARHCIFLLALCIACDDFLSFYFTSHFFLNALLAATCTTLRYQRDRRNQRYQRDFRLQLTKNTMQQCEATTFCTFRTTSSAAASSAAFDHEMLCHKMLSHNFS